MSRFVKVAEYENTDPRMIPTLPADNTLLLETLRSRYSGASGLEYRNPQTNDLYVILLSEGRLYPPEDGWGSQVYWCVFPHASTGRLNRMEKIIDSLRKSHITRPDEVTLSQISKSDKLLDYGVIKTEYAISVYQSVKEMAGTETKSYIGEALGLRINGSIFDNFPFILSAKDDESAKMIKILIVADRAQSLESRKQDLKNEIEACDLSHPAIVPMKHSEIEVDAETARRACCRVGVNNVIVMPWYTSPLNNYPSFDLKWCAEEGMRIMDALEYIHSQDYVHLDVKAANIFVSHDLKWFLGDFGSCKRIGEKVTSSTFQFYYEDIAFKPAAVKYDWFMFLILVLIETLKDRRMYRSLFYVSVESPFADFSKVANYAKTYLDNQDIGMLIKALLTRLQIQ